MELGIVGAVGLLGYLMSSKEARPPRQDQPPPTHLAAYPWGPGTEVQKLLEADRDQTKARWEQSLEPHLTGVVGGVVNPNTKLGEGPQPFFASAKKQHTNNALKQRRMEMFTGAVDINSSETGTYSRKKEVPNMFKPEWNAAPVTFSGHSAGTPIGIDQAARYVPSMRQNNVLPTQQVRVGPGVGVGAGVPAADGFHPMLRVMPQNVNEHRLNPLPGTLVVGASGVANGTLKPVLVTEHPPRYWEQRRRPTQATKAAVLAASERAAQLLEPCGGRMTGEDYYGTAGRVGSYTAGTVPTRDRFDNNVVEHQTNVTGAAHGVGAYAKATHDPSRLQSQHREQQQEYEGVVTGAKGPRADELHLLPQTNRSIHVTDVQGNPASHVDVGRTRPLDKWDRTLREQLHPQSQPGVAAPYIKGHSVTATHKWLDRESKRYAQHVLNWMPPAHMATDVRMPGIVQIKPRVELLQAQALPTTATPIAMAPIGYTGGNSLKLPSDNPRLDLGIAQRQLAENPLHVPLVH